MRSGSRASLPLIRNHLRVWSTMRHYCEPRADDSVTFTSAEWGFNSPRAHLMKQHGLLEFSILSSSGSFNFQVLKGRSRFIRAAANKAADPLSRRAVAILGVCNCASDNRSPILKTAILHHDFHVRPFGLPCRPTGSQRVPCGKLSCGVSTVHPFRIRLNGSVVCDRIGGDLNFPYRCGVAVARFCRWSAQIRLGGTDSSRQSCLIGHFRQLIRYITAPYFANALSGKPSRSDAKSVRWLHGASCVITGSPLL
jgi:hypothetical protein